MREMQCKVWRSPGRGLGLDRRHLESPPFKYLWEGVRDGLFHHHPVPPGGGRTEVGTNLAANLTEGMVQ